MKNYRNLRIDQEVYELLRTKKEELQKEKGEKITYSQLLKYLISGEISTSGDQGVSLLSPEVLVKIPQLEEVPIKCEMQVPIRLPEPGVLLSDEVEARVRKYADEQNVPFSEAVNILLLYALQLRSEVFVILPSDLKEEFERLHSVLEKKEREKLKKDLKKLVTMYTKKLLKSYSKKVKSRTQFSR
ncbi:hypothetical protein [Desulfurobacterium crinifex]